MRGAARVRGATRVAGRTTFVGWLGVVLCLACDTGPPPGTPTLGLPSRPVDALGGRAIADALDTLDLDAREERIYSEVARGNVPSWLRQLERVEITRELEGRDYRVAFWAAPDYLAIGSDDDYFYVPLSPRTALRIADLVGGSLPTALMVDAIWMAARSRLVPIRIRPDEFMGTVRYFRRHNSLVQAQRRQHNAPPGVFLAGHKLDVVLLTPVTGPGQVGLYGWHLPNGSPIQPLHEVDIDSEPHFSMGVRIVHGRILIDGREEDLASVLGSRRLAPLVGR